jgi:type VI protein secretion system component Hcp
LSTKEQNDDEPQPADAESTEEPLTEEQLESVAGGTFVKSWSTSADADDRPTEEVSFNYAKITWTYGTEDKKG